jgi:hypothetical protein
MPRVFIPAALALSAANAFAQDAVQTDGDKYKVILENECVRVLDYRDAWARRRTSIGIPDSCSTRSLPSAGH